MTYPRCNFLLFFSIIVIVSCSNPSDKEYGPFLEFQAELVNDSLISSSFPEGSISFEKNIQYIGSKTFILYKVARCEIHLFAELDAQGGFERLYWIQYEGYLPGKLLPFPANLKPGGLTYDYNDDPYRESIADKEFYVKTGNFNVEFSDSELNGKTGEDDSDFLNVARILNQKGININSEVLSVRMVQLNEDKSDELMIIYYESLEEEDQKIKALEGKGKASSQWDSVSSDLILRAKTGIHLTFKNN
ncbi:MAG: hypothetical protein HKN68_22650 [Saprospiraceae bacterium]|nr:hypothetical protein [Saprospiraceae bacterium]